MRLTIVKDDNLVIVDHRPMRFDLSSYNLAENFHALQWNNDFGEEEYNDGTPNKKIGDFSPYQPIINEHARLVEIADNPPPPSEKEKYTSLVNQRDQYLKDTDWLIVRHNDQSFHPHLTTSINNEQYLELIEWRQTLRELPQAYKTSDTWKWPNPPNFLIPEYPAFPK